MYVTFFGDAVSVQKVYKNSYKYNKKGVNKLYRKIDIFLPAFFCEFDCVFIYYFKFQHAFKTRVTSWKLCLEMVLVVVFPNSDRIRF